MPRQLCIHGHFYQPPREDPWMGEIFPEDSAAPSLNWNQRITRESYAPLAWARRIDSEGCIADIMNCYEWISFNAGPTLLAWMERNEPTTYRRILEADGISSARWGHGNAMAQAYHHTILPLASAQDKKLEIAWARADFRTRFGREPEGMWLAECAADIPTLEELASQGIRFTILSPHQASFVADKGDDDWQAVHGGAIDISIPYDIELPSGKTIAVFFYNGPISQAVAFERLLQDGEAFWQKLNHAAGTGLLTVCTDGETYGHHFTFGEMALAYTLGQAISGRDNTRLTNYATYLAQNPPTRKVRIHEPSSWSCAHGVERWKSNCGCTDGGHPTWNQEWRGPLREALDLMKRAVDMHTEKTGKTLFKNTETALAAYGDILSNGTTREAFSDAYFLPALSAAEQRKAWQLLAMQEQSLAAYASCAWFFDEISRIEPINGMTYALRAMEILKATGGPEIEKEFAAVLEKAQSNKPEEGNGRTIFEQQVLPRRETKASIILQAMLRLWAEKRLPCPNIKNTVQWPNITVTILPTDAAGGSLSGEARMRWFNEPDSPPVLWEWTPPKAGAINESCITLQGTDNFSQTFRYADLPRNKRQAIAMRAMEVANIQRLDAYEEDAANAVALFEPWVEAQHDQPLGHNWKANAPALAVAYMKHPNLTDNQRRQIAKYLTDCGLLICGGREIITNWLTMRLLRFIESAASSGTKDAEQQLERAASIVERARTLLPHPDLWAAQNRLWEIGFRTPAARKFAKAISFRV
ncbi:DUF3536 domain-containing protein [Desulfovibrio mangrovi]|uniref:DUF3536 domain-containing protein n=1 Tax=Desulfovibrio mangrovi TaxID=2976983 RepID=UPI002245EDA5|nr:DUF3536 domain-containing protein [Desulfovibrio mangrovi]UZP67826.1 DUF3536 domain-containing protein [Desulfovibrio mangrovi]